MANSMKLETVDTANGIKWIFIFNDQPPAPDDLFEERPIITNINEDGITFLYKGSTLFRAWPNPVSPTP